MAKTLTFKCPKRRSPYRNFYEKKICFYLGKKNHSFLDIDSIELGQRNGPIPHYNPVNIFFFNFQRTLKTNTLLHVFHIVFRFLYFFLACLLLLEVLWLGDTFCSILSNFVFLVSCLCVFQTPLM